MPLPALLYAQVVKPYRRRRVLRVRHRVVFGTLTRVNRVLAATGWQINTAFIERANGAIRQHVAAVGRRVITLCKGQEGVRHQLALYHGYDNFCLPHASLRRALPQPLPTNGTGSARHWQPCTPAMVAGLTDHVWSRKEVLLFRVPPWPPPQALQVAAEPDEHGTAQARCAHRPGRRALQGHMTLLGGTITGVLTPRQCLSTGPFQ
jgi:hypothetical protein